MEAKQISEIIQNSQTLAIQKSPHLGSGDLKFLQAINDRKVIEADVEELNVLFRNIFLLIGLRERSFPNSLETIFLFDHLRQHYGTHSVTEIKIAFEKAVRGELDLDPKDVQPYENFSVLYLSSIMNSYRRWSSQEYRRLERFIEPPEDQKLLGNSTTQPELETWPRLIEKAYQHFLSFGSEHSTFWPAGFYDQLCQDGVFDKDFWRGAMKIVRKKLVGDLIRERTKLEMGSMSFYKSGDPRMTFAINIRETNIREVNKKIDDYKSGELDGELELPAKQHSVLLFFQKCKNEQVEKIYGPEKK